MTIEPHSVPTRSHRPVRVAALCLAILAGLLASSRPAIAEGDLAVESLEWVKRGHQLLRVQRPKEACECFGHAALLLPTWWIPHFERASCGRVIGDPYEVLVRYAEAAATHAPASGVAWELLGYVHEDAGFPDRAAKAYERAVALDGRLREARIRLARFDLAEGRAAQARERFAAIRAEWPSDVRALSGLADAALALGEHAAAEEALLGLALRSNYPPPVYARLIALYRNEGEAGAARAAERAWQQAAAGRTVSPSLSPRLGRRRPGGR